MVRSLQDDMIVESMSPKEHGVGWFLLVTGAVALICLYYVESFRASQISAWIFGITFYALSALLTYDLFHRNDLLIRRRTLLTVLMWMIPCVNWLVFLRFRNQPRAVLE